MTTFLYFCVCFSLCIGLSFSMFFGLKSIKLL
uniref:Cytochrome b6f complex subunit 6 n=1 Tax=Bulboplastis apyrenoidosa TaxID=1070855 RepID=A0A1X9PVH7_9RHOD|nr:cytochrome b6f complex subunit 6 [Bulboplastis apyrenoidosa]ARO90713.1 cytochrome b6f complex subunit 6 [Bulboplastis apyrenoidosa]